MIVNAPVQLTDHVKAGLEEVTIGLRDIHQASSRSLSQSVDPVEEPVRHLTTTPVPAR